MFCVDLWFPVCKTHFLLFMNIKFGLNHHYYSVYFNNSSWNFTSCCCLSTSSTPLLERMEKDAIKTSSVTLATVVEESGHSRSVKNAAKINIVLIQKFAGKCLWNVSTCLQRLDNQCSGITSVFGRISCRLETSVIPWPSVNQLLTVVEFPRDVNNVVRTVTVSLIRNASKIKFWLVKN